MTIWSSSKIMESVDEQGWWDFARDMDEEPMNTRGVQAFIILNLIGGSGLLIVMLIAFLSLTVKRLATWYSFCTSWILSCISYTLLTFARQQYTPTPAFPLCFAQTALIYAVPPLTSCTTLSLVVQILMSFNDSISEVHSPASVRTLVALLMGPYIIFVIIFVGVCMFGAQNLSSVVKADRGTYCHSTDGSWQRVSFGFVIGVSVVIVIIQARLALQLYRHRSVMKWNSASIATTLRGLMFSLIGLMTVMTALAFMISSNHNLNLDIVLALLPVLAFIVFGTQRDLLEVWVFGLRISR